MNDPQRPLKIYLVAGEASGDLLGAHLMQAIRKLALRPVKFFGVGGPKMAEEGFSSLFPYSELSLMGFVEVLPYAYHVLTRINATVDDIMLKQPDIVVTIDSPGFNFRVVEKLRKEHNPSCKFVHYVAPTVWAYKPERAKRCAQLFDHMLVLLPFEPPYFEKEGLATTFVGHPVVAETSVGKGDDFRSKYEIAPETPLICLLPGSRQGEIGRHMPVFGRAVTMLSSQIPNLALAVAVPRNMLEAIAPYFRGCPFRTVLIGNEQDKKDAMAASNIAIVKSGTVSLEVAMAGTPMVIGYRVHPISAWMLRRHIQIQFVNLINIILNKEVIPELLQERCTPQMIASAAASLLANPSLHHAQVEAIHQALAQLVPGGSQPPSEIAANKILSLSQS